MDKDDMLKYIDDRLEFFNAQKIICKKCCRQRFDNNCWFTGAITAYEDMRKVLTGEFKPRVLRKSTEN